ncbi:MAG: hypothetical protein J6X69_01260 [Bacteroidales bacterium]|nr:hypothetical protein [Bacteroidales bacterium]
MEIIYLKKEENYKEYLRLLQDDNYTDVILDEESGGVSAVHKQHKFAKQKGVNGMSQGDYERVVVEVMRKNGYRIVLGAEVNIPGSKSFDGFLDDVPMEIKTIEGLGVWSVCTKLCQAERQKAQIIVLFFPKEELYSLFRIREGVRLFLSGMNDDRQMHLARIMIVVQDRMVADLNKKATPIEGWSF